MNPWVRRNAGIEPSLVSMSREASAGAVLRASRSPTRSGRSEESRSITAMPWRARSSTSWAVIGSWAEGQHETRERGRRRQGGRVHVGIDVTRNQDAAGRVDDPRARADHLVAHADVRDPFTARGDVGEVDLARVDVQQGPAAHIQIGGGSAASNVGEAAALSDGHSDQL